MKSELIQVKQAEYKAMAFKLLPILNIDTGGFDEMALFYTGTSLLDNSHTL